MDFMNWSEITTFEKTFWILALVSSLFFLGLMVMTFLGGDTDTDAGGADADVDADAGIGFQFLTIKNLMGFFTIFSWTGLACIDSGFETGSTLTVAFIAGFIMMTLMAAVFYMMSKLAASGTLQMDNAVGKLGEVYLKVPANRGGFGKVQLKVQGSLRELEAMTDDEVDIASPTIVEVKRVIDDSILLVTKSGK